MKAFSQQGMMLSASQRRHLALQKRIQAGIPTGHLIAVADRSFDVLRDTLNSRLFVGPPKPAHCYKMDDAADSASYWNMVEQYDRYARAESESTGTSSIAEWMGY